MIILLYLFNAFVLLGLVWLLKRQSWAQAIYPYFYPALLLKLLCGVLLGLLYWHHYGTGDTLVYHLGGRILANLAREDTTAYLRLLFFNEFSSAAFRASVPFSDLPGFTNSFFLLKLLSLLNLLTGNSYYLTGLYFSLFSFWGAARLSATLIQLFPKYKTAAVVAFLFFPSVVFWSSGLLKDAVFFGSMCWVVSFFLLLGHRQKMPLVTLLLALLMLLLFGRIKLFLALMLVPLLLSYVLIKLYKPLFRQERRQAAYMAVASILLALAGLLFFKFYADGFFYSNLTDSYHHLLALSQGKPHIAYQVLYPNLVSFATNAPEAILSAVYRPFLGESGNVLFILLGLENLVLLLLTLLAIAAAWRGAKPRITIEDVLFAALIIEFAFIFGLSTPNFGTLSRYRIAFLPFLLYLLLQHQYSWRLFAKRNPR